MADEHLVRERGRFLITSDPAATDLDFVCAFLRDTYWAGGTSREALEASFRPSLVYNLFDRETGRQIGFGRVLTDRARFAWLSDVFVVDDYRGQGLGKWLVETIMGDPRLGSVGRWLLATRDAHDLYRQFGWEDASGGRYMVFTPQTPS